MNRLLIVLTFVLFVGCSTSKRTGNDLEENYGQVVTIDTDDLDSTNIEEVIDAVLAAEPPVLIGGLAGLRVNYPERARKRGVQGAVVVQFVVNKKGKAENIKVLRGIGHGCDSAARNAVKRAKFTPGKDSNGEPVLTLMRLPINFRLDM